MAARRIRREPLRIDVKHEEDRAIRHIARKESVRLPRVDRNDGVVAEAPAPVTDVDAGRCATDVKDQMAFAMRMHVEGTVQLIDRRATEPAVEDGERPAHALPPAGCSRLV